MTKVAKEGLFQVRTNKDYTCFTNSHISFLQNHYTACISYRVYSDGVWLVKFHCFSRESGEFSLLGPHDDTAGVVVISSISTATAYSN